MSGDKARFQFDQGLQFFQKGDYARASTFFKDAIFEQPEFLEALYNLACCCSVLGDKDNALVYLDRAVRLNMHCMDWAKEDPEFDSLKEDPLFRQITKMGEPTPPEPGPLAAESPHDDFQETSFPKVEEKPKPAVVSEMPNFDDGRRPKTEIHKESLPSCLRCGGLVQVERRSRYNAKVMLGVVLLGLILLCNLFFLVVAFVGLIVIIIGLYFFSQIDDVWVCQNCGASGEGCGYPPSPPKNASVTT